MNIISELSTFFASAPDEDAILGYQLPEWVDNRVQVLMDKNNEGELTRHEMIELDQILAMTQFLELVVLKIKVKRKRGL